LMAWARPTWLAELVTLRCVAAATITAGSGGWAASGPSAHTLLRCAANNRTLMATVRAIRLDRAGTTFLTRFPEVASTGLA